MESHKNFDLTIERNEDGKPYFKNAPYFFSISHSNGIVAVVLSDKNIGIDIEWLNKTRDFLSLSKRIFSNEEQKKIINSNDLPTDFYSIWTKKEAFAKLTGNGLASIFRQDIENSVRFDLYKLSIHDQDAILSICRGCDDNSQIIVCDSNNVFTVSQI